MAGQMKLIDFDRDVVSITDVGLVRKANEDNCFATETPNGFLFVVCDGMGGHVGGAKASTIAVTSIVNFFNKEKYVLLHQALNDALLYANRQIMKAAAENPEFQGMGTTACVVLMRDDKVWYAHVGDSRIYLYNNSQRKLYRLTKDHSVVQGLVDQGLISEAEAENHPNKNRILRTLGIKQDVLPEVCSTPALPAKGDVLLLCSDGLSGMVSDEILQHILQQKTPLQEKGENMVAFAKQAGGVDNITLQLISISNSPRSGKRRNGGWTLLIIIAAVLLAFAITGYVLNSQEEKRTPVPAPMPEIVIEQKAWEKLVAELGYQMVGRDDRGYVVYAKERPRQGREFIGMIVYSDDSYSTGSIFLNSDNTFGIIKVTRYNKDGTPK